MIKKYLVIILIFISFYSFSYTLILKDDVIINNTQVFLQDIILNQLPTDIPNIIIADLKENTINISSNKILEILFSNSIYNINLIGENTVIHLENNALFEDNLNDPLEYLQEYFELFFDNNIFTIKIDLLKIEPEVNIKIIKYNYKWEINKSNYNISELKEIKNLSLIIEGKRYQATLDIKIFSNIWTAKQTFQKNDYFKEEGFLKNYVDITKMNNIDTVVFDIKKAKNSTFISNISPGETLKWTLLKKNPSVIKGESINAILKKNPFEIILPCFIINDGYEDEKIKVKLVNGKEIFGILRNNNGEIYLEIL